MKKLIILATLLLPLISLAQDVDAGAGTAIRSDQAERREDGLTYEINAETPYTGLVKGVYPNGQKSSEANFVNGKLEGLETEWNENGGKQAETTFVNGKRNGPATTWYENGQKKSERNYANGQREGLRTDEYNTRRPHSALGYRPPAPLATSPWDRSNPVSQPLAVM